MGFSKNFDENKAPRSTDDHLTVPLLEMEVEDEDLASEDKLSQRVPFELAFSSVLVGICIGSLLHLAIIGGSFVMIMSLDLDASSTTARVFAYGLSFIISFLAIALSSAVRFLLGLAMTSSVDHTPSNNELAYVRLCNLLGLVTGIFLASLSTESIMDWNRNHFLLHFVGLLVWVAAALFVAERSYAKGDSSIQDVSEHDSVDGFDHSSGV